MAIGQGETPILPEIKIPLPLGDELPAPVLQGGISLTQNWDKNGNIFYTDENGNRVNNSIGLLENLKRKAQTIGTNIKDAFNSQPYDRRDTFYTSPMPTLINQYDNGAISADELARLSKNRMDDEIYKAEKDQRESNLRSGLGTAISGASFLPIFNIPYVGTGIGGAMYDIGQGLVEGDNINDIANRAGRGFAIGESVGAIPYVGKGINKLSGGRIGDAAINLTNNVISKTGAIRPIRTVKDLLNQDISNLPSLKYQTETLYDSKNPLHRQQADLINKYNPAPDSYHTWIRNADDIYNFEDTLKPPNFDADFIGNDFDPSYTWDMAQDAIKNGQIDVYSSYPIDKGVFVTPSTMEAGSYAGNGKVYHKRVPLKDVAWIDERQGQYAPIKEESLYNKLVDNDSI